jgi:hypothetical protein
MVQAGRVPVKQQQQQSQDYPHIRVDSTTEPDEPWLLQRPGATRSEVAQPHEVVHCRDEAWASVDAAHTSAALPSDASLPARGSERTPPHPSTGDTAADDAVLTDADVNLDADANLDVDIGGAGYIGGDGSLNSSGRREWDESELEEGGDGGEHYEDDGPSWSVSTAFNDTDCELASPLPLPIGVEQDEILAKLNESRRHLFGW